jgi:hypothetical protein
VSLVVGLAIAEVILRVIGSLSPNFYTLDADRGIALRPNVPVSPCLGIPASPRQA